MATGRAMVLVACSLALAQLAVLCRAAEEQKLQELCSGEKLELRSLSDLKRTSAEGCAEPIVNAFDDLVKLVFNSYNYCAMEQVTGITQYYETHLKNGRQDTLPDELVRFAIAYGMQFNSQCKWVMTGPFYEKVDELVSESEYDEIKQWTSDEGPIAPILSPIIEQGEFLLPSDFETLLPKPEREALLGLGSVDKEKLIRVKDLCKNRFRKLYDVMLLPIAHLDRNGLNYKSGRLTRHLVMSIETRKHNILWSRIVFLCETLREMGDFNDEEMGPSQVENIQGWKFEVKIKDLIVDNSDSSLKSAIKSYDVNLSELDRFKNRISHALKSSGQSKETMASLIERVFEDENGGGEQDEELKATKKELLSMLDPANRDKFVKAISKMSTGGKRAGRRVARALTTLIITSVSMLTKDRDLAEADLHAYKRDFTKRYDRRYLKNSDMRHQTFENA